MPGTDRIHPRDEGDEEDAGIRNVRVRHDEGNGCGGSEDEEEDEDDEQAELLFEERAAITLDDRGTYTFHSTLRKSFEFDEELAELETKLYFQGTTSDAPETEVGNLKGHLLRRSRWYGDFHAMADSVSIELQGLACMFCEGRGDITRVPTGLEEKGETIGNFLHIDSVQVAKDHRGKADLGLHLVHHALGFLHLRSDDEKRFSSTDFGWKIAVMVPFGGEDTLKVQRHFSRMGFRQAGRNLDQFHAFYLTASEYFSSRPYDKTSLGDATGRWKTKQEGEAIDIYVRPEQVEPTGADRVLNELVRLHVSRPCIDGAMPFIGFSIVSLVGMYGASIHNARALHTAAAANMTNTFLLSTLIGMGGNVNLGDECGLRPLHIAAASNNIAAISFLLAFGADKTLTDEKGDTALDCSRLAGRDECDFFEMHDIPLRVDDIMRRFSTSFLLAPLNIQALLVDGWLSPRVLHMFSITASDNALLTQIDAENTKGGRPTPLALLFVDLFERLTGSSYLPPKVLKQNPNGVYKSFVEGWGYVWEAMERLLERKLAPSVGHIEQEIESKPESYDPRTYHHFLSKGGKIEYAVDALVSTTRNVLVESSDFWKDYHNDEFEALPETPFNDAYSFDIARTKLLGLPAGSAVPKMGPYMHEVDGEKAPW